MPAKWTKLNIVAFICLSVLLFTLGCILSNRTQYPSGIMPVRSLRLSIDKSQREILFDQLNKFAEKYEFKIDITDFNTNGKHFQFWMAKDDISIVASNVPPDPTLVAISFYWDNFWSPADEDTINDLLDDLMRFVSEVPDMKVLEVK